MKNIILFALLALALISCQRDNLSRVNVIPPSAENVDTDSTFTIAVAVDPQPLGDSVSMWSNCFESTELRPDGEYELRRVRQVVCPTEVGHYFLYEGVLVAQDENGELTPSKIVFLAPCRLTTNDLITTNNGNFVKVRLSNELQLSARPTYQGKAFVYAD
jgi:hypothetical protein